MEYGASARLAKSWSALARGKTSKGSWVEEAEASTGADARLMPDIAADPCLCLCLSCLAQCDDPTRTGSVDAFLCDDLDNNALDPLPDNTTNATKRSTSLAAHDVAHATPTTPPTTTLAWVCGKAGYEVQCPVNATTNQTGVVVGFCGSGESAACKIDSVKGHFGCDHKKGHDVVNHAVACEMGFEVTLDEEQECYHECMDAQEYKTCAAGYVAVGHCGGASNPKCGHTVTECQAYPRTFSAMKCCQVRTALLSCC